MTISHQHDLKQIRLEYGKMPQFISDGLYEAVICESYITPKKYVVCVNYWTKREIAKEQRNVTGTLEFFVAKLYPEV